MKRVSIRRLGCSGCVSVCQIFGQAVISMTTIQYLQVARNKSSLAPLIDRLAAGLALHRVEERNAA